MVNLTSLSVVALLLFGCTSDDPTETPDTSQIMGDTHVDTTTETDSSATSNELLREFDGISPNGTWLRMLPHTTEFPVTVAADGLTVLDDGGANQHVVRSGVNIDTTRAYSISVDFEFLPPLEGLNSFAVLFAVGGTTDDDLGPIDAMAINVDVRSDGSGAVMKYMGFMDGGFRSIGERSVSWGATGVVYTMTIDVAAGLSRVAVEVYDGETLLESFEQDYTTFPWQPESGASVRFGLNSHGADWVARQLRIQYQKAL